MTSTTPRRSAPLVCPLCHAPMQRILRGTRREDQGAAWRCSRSPACGGLLLEDRVESEASGAVAGSGAGEPLRSQRVTRAGKRESIRPSHDGAESAPPAPGGDPVKVERIRLRPRGSSPGPAPRPGPSRGPRSGLSPARIGVLLLCFAAAGVAVLLWALRAPALNWVEASFPELATGFRTAFNGSDPTVPHRDSIASRAALRLVARSLSPNCLRRVFPSAVLPPHGGWTRVLRLWTRLLGIRRLPLARVPSHLRCRSRSMRFGGGRIRDPDAA